MKTRIVTAALGLLWVGIALGAEPDATKDLADRKKLAQSAIQGAWGNKDDKDTLRALKFIANGKWTVTNSDRTTGKVLFHHGGSYTFDGLVYVEKVEFATEGTADLIGKSFKFELSVNGDVLHQKGIENPWTEDWTRAKP